MGRFLILASLLPALAATVLASEGHPAPDDPTPPRTDVFGDPLPPGAVARLGSTRLRHPGEVRDVAFSPDGSRLAVTSEDGTASVWDADTTRLVFRAEAGPRATVEFGPDGKTVGTFAPGVGLRVFDPDTGKVLRTATPKVALAERDVGIPGRQPSPVLTPGLRSLAFRLGEINRCRLVVVDPTTGREAFTAALPSGWMTMAGFSPDGGRLAVADGSSAQSVVRVLDTETGRVLFDQAIDGLYPRGVGLSRGGGRVMATVSSHSGPNVARVRVWDVASGKQLLDHPGYAAAFSPDGKTVAMVKDRAISLIAVATGKVEQTLETRLEFARLFFSPDGTKLAVASNHNRVELFDLKTGRRRPDPAEDFPDPDIIYFPYDGGIRFGADGKVVTRTHLDRRPAVWDPLTGRRLETVDPPPGGRYVWGFSPDGGRLLYSSGPARGPGELRVWDRTAKSDVVKGPFPDLGIASVVYSPDGAQLVYVPETHQKVCVLDPSAPTQVRQFPLTGGRFLNRRMLWGMTLSADGGRLFGIPGQARGAIRWWDVTTGVEGPEVRWAPDAVARGDRVGPVRFAGGYAVSADGRRVAVFQFIGRRTPPRPDNGHPLEGGRFLSVFDATDGRESVRFPVPKAGEVESRLVVLSPDGRLVVLHGYGGYCRVFEVASGTERRRITAHVGTPSTYFHGVSVAAFSRDGRLLVTVSPEQAGLVWDLHEADAFRGDLAAAWDALAERSAEKAFPALARLAGRGDEAARFLADRVRPADAPTAEQVAAWVEQLDAPAFRDREDAERRLRAVVAGYADRFAAQLKRAAEQDPSPEVGLRMARVLAALNTFEPPVEDVRAARAVEVLERIGTPAARQTLEKLSAGPVDGWLTRDAKAALGRLGPVR